MRSGLLSEAEVLPGVLQVRAPQVHPSPAFPSWGSAVMGGRFRHFCTPSSGTTENEVERSFLPQIHKAT